MKSIKVISIIGLFFFLLSGCEKAAEDLPTPYMESFADVGECLSYTPLKGNQPGPNQSCIFYEYDGDSVLKITHYNSAFNCCPEEIITSFEFRNDTIFIVEDDAKELCRCNCLFNVEMTIHNLPPGRYIMKVSEPNVPQEDQIFMFELDLNDVPADQVCKYREFYPWHAL